MTKLIKEFIWDLLARKDKSVNQKMTYKAHNLEVTKQLKINLKILKISVKWPSILILQQPEIHLGLK